MAAIHHEVVQRPVTWERIGLASGVVYSAGQLAALGYFATQVFPQMGPSEAAEQHVAFYVQQGDVLALGNYLLTLPTPFFLLFLGGLFGALRRAEGDSGTLSVAAVVAGGGTAMLWPLSAVLNNLGITIARAGGDRATVVALDGIGAYMLALSTLPRTVLLAAASTVLLRQTRVPRWLGWSGLGLGVFSLVGSATLVAPKLFPILALGTLGFDLWVVALSLGLLQSSQPIREGVAPSPST